MQDMRQVTSNNPLYATEEDCAMEKKIRTEEIDEKICLNQAMPAITFAYKKSIDKPENHRLHINRLFEIYIYIDGDADYIVGDKYFSLRYGDMIVMNQYVPHNVVLKSEGLYERFYLLFPLESFAGHRYDPFRNMGRMLISLPEGKRRGAVEILYKIRDTLAEEKDQRAHFKAYGLIMEFLAEISGEKGEALPSEREAPSRLPKYIAEILVYINKNAVQIRSADEIAKAFGLSMPYLSTTFRNAIGTPLKSYIQAKKIACAKELLDKDCSVTEACYESGFNDCSYFIKVFRQHVGMTPLRYKNSR